jgi:FlaG/FlaF family flagellin (archaellin)
MRRIVIILAAAIASALVGLVPEAAALATAPPSAGL